MSDAATVRATTSAALMARPVTKVTCMRIMLRREMTTVMPAKSTDRPAVSIATVTESRTLCPPCSCSRYRVTMSSA